MTQCNRPFNSLLLSNKLDLYQVPLPCKLWTCPHCADQNKTKWELHIKNLITLNSFVWVKTYTRPDWPALYHRAHRAKAQYVSILIGQGRHLVFFSKPVGDAEMLTAREAIPKAVEAIAGIKARWRHSSPTGIEHPIRTSHRWRLPPHKSLYTLATPKPVVRRAFTTTLQEFKTDTRATTWDGKLVIVGLTSNLDERLRKEIIERAQRATAPCENCSESASFVFPSNSATDHDMLGEFMAERCTSPPSLAAN